AAVLHGDDRRAALDLCRHGRARLCQTAPASRLLACGDAALEPYPQALAVACFILVARARVVVFLRELFVVELVIRLELVWFLNRERQLPGRWGRRLGRRRGVERLLAILAAAAGDSLLLVLQGSKEQELPGGCTEG